MAEQTTQTVSTENAAATPNVADAGLQLDPFSESSWSTQPVTTTAEAAQALDPKTTEPAPETPSAPEVDLKLKENLGYDKWEDAKAEIESLRKLKDAPPTAAEIKFENEQSKKLYEAWTGGKQDEVFSYLEKQKQLSGAQALDVTKADDAAKILKLNLQLKHSDLTKSEVDYMFNQRFALPKKPVQSEDELDADYEEKVSAWKDQVSDKEKGMIIEAKLAKPDLAKYHSELVMPDIPKVEPTAKEPTPEELAEFEKQRTAYVQNVDNGLNALKGFQAEYKDEEVAIPISYEVSKEEKAALKPILESLYTGWDYFGKRWANADGSINTALMGEDLYLLENKGKVFQKFANESGAQRLIAERKKNSNIQLGGNPQRAFVPDNAKNEEEKLADFFLSI